MGGFRSSVWDPILIVSQILTMQSVFYVTLGSWVYVMDCIADTYRSLDQLFAYEALQIKQFQGRLILIAYVLNAFTGALGLWYIVKRTKQCLDFAATMHLLHLIVCWAYTSHFPWTVTWWMANTVSIIIMTVLAEFLCMRTELKAIPLGPKADL